MRLATAGQPAIGVVFGRRLAEKACCGSLQAAVYGTLAGSVASVLPACQRWEDTTWALLRCWLDTTVDHRLWEVPVRTQSSGAWWPDACPQRRRSSASDPRSYTQSHGGDPGRLARLCDARRGAMAIRKVVWMRIWWLLRRAAEEVRRASRSCWVRSRAPGHCPGGDRTPFPPLPLSPQGLLCKGCAVRADALRCPPPISQSAHAMMILT